MTTINCTSLLRFCLGLLIASLAATSFATKKPAAAKSKAATAKVVKQSIAKAAKPAKPSVEDWGPGAIQGSHVKRANLKLEAASPEARQMADWVVDSGDNRNMPFVILDKKDARVYVFHPHGGLRGAAPVLLGITVGDDSFPGVGNKPLSQVLPEEKTTPAGRYLAASDKNIKGADIVWIDYDSAVSFHAVVKGKPEERRAERLTSPLPSERRISFGCVNVPVNFFKTALHASFKKSDGMVYVLPETRSVNQVFASFYDVNQKEKLAAAAQDDPIAQFAAPTKISE
ncbi:MAG: hypothetical protein ABL923_01970 [Burkholderiaceae bacterium]